MRKLAAALTVLLILLSGCAHHAGSEYGPTQASPPTAETEEPSAFAFTSANFPRIDGSTATYPMARALCAHLLDISPDEADARLSFTETTRSYYQLMDGLADILIVYECGPEVEQYRREQGFDWEKAPFASDGFVFFVNSSNPVSSITVDEARRIYTGEITNWAQLGGDDLEIIPFQRNPEAGSQTLMRKLVMQGEELMDAPEDYIIGSMSEIINAVSSYDNSPGAIGYSVYYYANDMRMAQGVKLLKIGGVEPDSGTIRSGEYPLINPLYTVINADEPETSPARALYDWLLSEPGQRLAAEQGYVSVMDFEAGTGNAGSSDARTPVGSRWYDDYTPELIPRDDYGPLVPYAGRRLGSEWYYETGCLYGLMTKDGAAVTDPVYAQVLGHGDVLILRRGVGGEGRVAVAAMDGSRCSGFDYTAYTTCPQGLVMLAPEGVTLMALDGEIYRRFGLKELGLSQAEMDEMIRSVKMFENSCGEWVRNYLSLKLSDDGQEIICYDLDADKLVTMERWGEWENLSDAHPLPQPPEDGRWVLDSLLGTGAPRLIERYDYDTGETIYFRADGTELPELTLGKDQAYDRVNLAGGIVEKLELNWASYYDLETMECVFRTYMEYEID